MQAAQVKGKFDPTALQRGAKALQDLEQSPNASQAFELTKLSEQTKEKEAQKTAEQQQVARAQGELQHAQQQAHRQRQMISQRNEQEKQTAENKARLDSELYQSRLDEQQKQAEQRLQQQHQQFLRQEELRVKNNLELEERKQKMMEERAKLDRETAILRANAESRGKIDEERETLDVRLRQMRVEKAEERKTKIESIQAVFTGLGHGSQALLEDHSKISVLVLSLTALAVGVYGARAGTRIAGNLLERYLVRPPLVRETSRWTWDRRSWFPFGAKQSTQIFEKIVLEEELSQRLQWTTNSLVNTRKNGTPFRHMLLHGAPGTGKTLFARTLAKQSGLDYAIMSGGDVGPLGQLAVTELNKLFKWANASRKGLILFIDEAESFLRTGRGGDVGMSEDARNVLSAFLHHTGTESEKFVVVLATNLRESLDRAVVDRMDESFEFPLPSVGERKQMLKLFMEQHIHKPTRRGQLIDVDPSIDQNFLDEVARQTEGFSGRQLAKLVLAYQAAVFGSGTKVLTKGLAETVLKYKLAHRDEEHERILRDTSSARVLDYA